MITAKPEIMSQYGHIFDKQIKEVLPEWILKNFAIDVIELTAGSATFELGYNPDLYRKIPGPDALEILSGQAAMSLADTLLIFPVIAQVGQLREFVTLNSSTEFLRPVTTKKVTITANVIRAGSKVIRGQVALYDADNKLSALSTICYIYTQ